jgi:hypothetical protein
MITAVAYVIGFIWSLGFFLNLLAWAVGSVPGQSSFFHACLYSALWPLDMFK